MNDAILNIFKTENSGGKPAIILLVDDNRHAALALAKLLRHHGHTVQIAYDGEAAIRAAQEAPINVVVLDIGLPGKDGYETIGLLRKVILGPAVFIALTAHGQPQDKQKAQAAGFDYHLTKPVLVAEIEELIFAHQKKIEKKDKPE